MPIAEDVKLGAAVRIAHPSLVNLYGCTMARRQKSAHSSRSRKMPRLAPLQDLINTFICEASAFEDEVFVGHGVMFRMIAFRAPRTWR